MVPFILYLLLVKVNKSWAKVAQSSNLWSSYRIVAKSQNDLVDAVNIPRYKDITKLRLLDDWLSDTKSKLLPAIVARMSEVDIESNRMIQPDERSPFARRYWRNIDRMAATHTGVCSWRSHSGQSEWITSDPASPIVYFFRQS